MKKIEIGQAIQIVANLGVLAGIVFLAYELRQNTLATQLSAANSFAVIFGEPEMLIIENPEFAAVLRKGREGEELTPTEDLRLTVFYRRVLRGWQIAHYQYLTHALDENLWSGTRDSLARTVAEDEGLRSYWRANTFTFAPAFNELIETMLQEKNLD